MLTFVVAFVLIALGASAQVYERYQHIGNGKAVVQPKKAGGRHE